jgi:hypothetical protein
MDDSAVSEHPSNKEHVCPRSIEEEQRSDGPLVRAWDWRDAEFEKMIFDLKIDRTPAWYSTIAEWKRG